MNYIGEIIIFLFYLSVGFLGLSFISYKYPIELISLPTFFILISVYLISFKNWAIFLSNKLSLPVAQGGLKEKTNASGKPHAGAR